MKTNLHRQADRLPRDVELAREKREAERKAELRAETQQMARGERALTSTRKGAYGTDAHRDMDGFDVDEELERFELAMKLGRHVIAAELAQNLNENAQRGGPIPFRWLGPICMRTPTDQRHARKDALARERESKRKVPILWLHRLHGRRRPRRESP